MKQKTLFFLFFFCILPNLFSQLPADSIYQTAKSFDLNGTSYQTAGKFNDPVLEPRTGSFTIAVTFTPKKSSASLQFVAAKANAGSTNVGWSIFIESGSIRLRVCGNGSQAAGHNFRASVSAPFADATYLNKETKLVGIVDRATGKVDLYINGSNSTSTIGGGGPTSNVIDADQSITSTSYPMTLGVSAINSYYLTGSFTDVKTYNWALSAAEITASSLPTNYAYRNSTSYNFTGTNSAAICPNYSPSPNLGSYTVIFRFIAKSTASIGYQTIASYGNTDSNEPGWSILLGEGSLGLRVCASNNTSGNYKASAQIPFLDSYLNTPNIGAAIIDRTSGKVDFYLNGKNMGTVAGGFGLKSNLIDPADSITSNTKPTFYMGQSNAATNLFNGTLQSLTLYNRALTADEIAKANIFPISYNLPFTNNAVIQRDQPITIIGTATPKDTLTLTLDTETQTAYPDGNGNWSCTFSAKAAKSTAFTLTGTGKKSIANTISNLLCGDVWVASGQSNMQMSLDGTNWAAVTNGSSEITNANYPNIRLIRPVNMWQQAQTAQTAENTYNGGWQVCSPTTVGGYTAVGYFFARQLFQDQNIPIGIIQAAVGGTRIEAWTPLAGLQSISEYASWYTKVTTTTIESGQTYNRKNFPTGNYNGMIAPFTHNPVKGIIWYQGEENLGQDGPSAQYEYGNKLKATIQSWRTVWNIADLPVIFTELANYTYNLRWATGMDALPRFIVQQRTATKLANVYGITISDISDFTNIHPANKQDVGARMGNIALQHIYGKNIEATPATFKEMKSEGSALRVTFNNNSNLHLSNGTVINEFQVAGEDKVYKIATATLKDNDVLVSESTIAQPLYIKYAWGENSNPNLFNASNTPTSRFADSLKLNQIIFTAIPATFKVGDSNLTLQATATSGLPVTFVSSNTNVATIVNGQLNIVGEGSANITAAEPGNTTYAAAVPVVQAINVISSTALSNQTVSPVKLHYNKTQCAVIARGVSAGDSIHIFSSVGKILAWKIAISNECSLQLSHPSTGTYLICISKSNKSTIFKLTI